MNKALLQKLVISLRKMGANLRGDEKHSRTSGLQLREADDTSQKRVPSRRYRPATIGLLAVFLPLLPLRAQVPWSPNAGELFVVETAGTLTPQPEPSTERQREIQKWIRDLVRVSQQDVGYSASQSGAKFAPQAASGKVAAALLGQRRPVASSTFTKLVAAGPDALPQLLQHLDDPTPTRLVIRMDGPRGLGGMHFDTEMPFNPAAREKATPSSREKGVPAPEHVERQPDGSLTYVVKVGDLCFTAIGQIVGRGFQAVRYQPTAFIIINSPVHSPELAAAVRSNWNPAASREGLFKRLLLDFSTRGRVPRKFAEFGSPSPWDWASETQSEAARRLLFYYGRDGESVVGPRMSKLDLSEPAEDDWPARRKVLQDNGVEVVDLIRAVADSSSPATREEIVEIARRTGDQQIWLTTAPVVATQDRLFLVRRTRELLRALPSGDDSNGRGLLSLLLRYAPNEARRDCEQFLATEKPARIWGVTTALEERRPAWATQFLRCYLRDERVLLESDQWRVCDSAASSLHTLNPRLAFDGNAPLTTRNRQIAAMRRTLK